MEPPHGLLSLRSRWKKWRGGIPCFVWSSLFLWILHDNCELLHWPYMAHAMLLKKPQHNWWGCMYILLASCTTARAASPKLSQILKPRGKNRKRIRHLEGASPFRYMFTERWQLLTSGSYQRWNAEQHRSGVDMVLWDHLYQSHQWGEKASERQNRPVFCYSHKAGRKKAINAKKIFF